MMANIGSEKTTTTTTALTIAARPLTPAAWKLIQAIAPTLHKSRLFGVTSPEQAAAIMLKGHELGLSLTAAFEFVQVIQGKPTLSPRGALALILRSGELDGMKVTDKPNACHVWMRRKNGFEYETTWTMEDARKAGLIKPSGAWEAYGPNMCRWRAIGFCADVVFPDVLGGLKRADEFGANIDAQGNVIEGEWTTAAGTGTAPDAASVAMHAGDDSHRTETITLERLLEQFTAEQIMAVNNGRIPETQEEIELAAVMLNLGPSPFAGEAEIEVGA